MLGGACQWHSINEKNDAPCNNASGQLQLADLAAGLAARLPSYAQPRIVRCTTLLCSSIMSVLNVERRLVPELDMTGTFKLKKRELQESGWSPGEVGPHY